MKKREMGQKCAESIYAELRILDKLSLETKKKYEKEEYVWNVFWLGLEPKLSLESRILMKKRDMAQMCAECILARLRT